MGDKLVEIAKENKEIVAITAAMTDGTGLTEFAKRFPNRFFDVGIAEQHAVGLAAGFAKEGMIPVVPIYSSFLQRAYDQIVHDVAIQNLPVVLISDRSGIVGNDGETHQGLLDMAFCNTVPNLNIMAPKDFRELESMLEFSITLKKPVLIRYPRGSEDYSFEQNSEISLGKSEILKIGNKISIFAIGKMVYKAWEVAKRLEKQGISTEVINVRFLKPLDKKALLASIRKTKFIVTMEDGTEKDGLSAEVENLIVESGINKFKFLKFAYPDEFVKHGSPDKIEKKYGMDIESMTNAILNAKELNEKITIRNIKDRGNKWLKSIENNFKVMKKNY